MKIMTRRSNGVDAILFVVLTGMLLLGPRATMAWSPCNQAWTHMSRPDALRTTRLGTQECKGLTFSALPTHFVRGGPFVGRRMSSSEENESTSTTTTASSPSESVVVIDPDFRVAALFLSAGIVLDFTPALQLVTGPLLTVLGFLFLYQTFRIRFVFDDQAIELKQVENENELKDSGENVVVGGANRWNYDTIVNYEFFPEGWIDNPIGPVLVYFKETQTPAERWNQGPGKRANDPAKIASGEAVAGQVHFFPAVCNAQQIREQFEKRGVRKLKK